MNGPFREGCRRGNEKGAVLNAVPFSDSLGARTQDPNIKSVVLYLLS